MPTDVHQHIWPARLIALLRARTAAPRLDGWTLHLDGEPPYDVAPADHDTAARAALAAADGLDLALVSLSSPLGIELLPPDEADELLAAYHDGVHDLPPPFGAWAAASLTRPDPAALTRELARGAYGLQLPANALVDEAGWRATGPLLEALEAAGKPLFVHPGPAAPAPPGAPSWWPALVPYVTQMHASWHAFRAFGRARHPRLRVCFALLAGLAPLHGERLAARSAAAERDRGAIDPQVFYETSSYGTRAVDAMLRTTGIDALCAGSDRPYAEPVHPDLGDAAALHALRTTNPARLLNGA